MLHCRPCTVCVCMYMYEVCVCVWGGAYCRSCRAAWGSVADSAPWMEELHLIWKASSTTCDGWSCSHAHSSNQHVHRGDTHVTEHVETYCTCIIGVIKIYS